jgi:hypothetical protein
MSTIKKKYVTLHLEHWTFVTPHADEVQAEITSTRKSKSMANDNLRNAKAEKNDEFYTQFHDIEVEMNAYVEYNPDVFRGKTILLPCDDPEWSNFTKYFAAKFDELGIKKLISTSYAPQSKKFIMGDLFSPFEQSSPQFDADKSRTHGKLFILERDITGDGYINIDDLEWTYLEGNGDFRSREVTRYRDEADIIITNPPFSLFREFLAWIMAAGKRFSIIGNMNAITYKEVFPLIMENRAWLGGTGLLNDMVFAVPEGADVKPSDRDKAARMGYVGNYTRLGNSCWFTNLDHGRRHEPLALMTTADNLRYSKHKDVCGKATYDHYDNYDAIEVPYTDAIPSDYDGAMGVPISWLAKYCPEQFEILGITKTWFGFASKTYPEQIQISKNGKESRVSKLNDGAAVVITSPINDTYYKVDGILYKQLYARIIIRHKS